MYKYYSLLRPISIGTFPQQTDDNRVIDIINFDVRELVENNTIEAWGYLIYKNPLTEKQISDYELKESLICKEDI